jgi:hypothetical protein
MERKQNNRIVIFLMVLGFSMLSFTNFRDDIKGWFLAGSNPESYVIGVENDSKRNGNVGYLKSIQSKIKKEGFGTIMQQFTPKEYLGKKVRLTGYVKSYDIEKWAGMWMRVDGENREVLSFDNMQSRPIKGSTDWSKYEIILDVPENSKLIAYGVLLSGTGQIWLDGLNFEIIGSENQTTGTGRSIKLDKPTNTDFEE